METTKNTFFSKIIFEGDILDKRSIAHLKLLADSKKLDEKLNIFLKNNDLKIRIYKHFIEAFVHKEVQHLGKISPYLLQYLQGPIEQILLYLLFHQNNWLF